MHGTTGWSRAACKEQSARYSVVHYILFISTAVLEPALLNPKTPIFLQKLPSYSGNLNSETPGDSKNAFQHCGDVLDGWNGGKTNLSDGPVL